MCSRVSLLYPSGYFAGKRNFTRPESQSVRHGENALTLRRECRMCRGPFGFAQGRLFDYLAASFREAATSLRMTLLSDDPFM